MYIWCIFLLFFGWPTSGVNYTNYGRRWATWFEGKKWTCQAQKVRKQQIQLQKYPSKVPSKHGFKHTFRGSCFCDHLKAMFEEFLKNGKTLKFFLLEIFMSLENCRKQFIWKQTDRQTKSIHKQQKKGKLHTSKTNKLTGQLETIRPMRHPVFSVNKNKKGSSWPKELKI